MVNTDGIASILGVSPCRINIEIQDITCNSKECGSGIAFAALVGEKFDGHNFADDAYIRGTRVFIVERKLNLPRDCIQFIVDDSRAALSSVSLFIHQNPQKKLKLIGVTGTKGKSTVVLMIHKILTSIGKKAIFSSTLGINTDGSLFPSFNSTPESDDMARFLSCGVDSGAEYAVIEVSSQGIKQKRVDALKFDIGVMTNLSRDHIGRGEHSDFAEYMTCKQAFFEKCKFGIFNADDKYFSEFSNICEGSLYGIKNSADISAKNVKIERLSNDFRSEFDISSPGQTAHFSLPIPGTFAVYDALAAVGACIKLGIPLSKCADALLDFHIEGRFEKINVERDIDVVIDYAHNGESLKNALKTARRLARGKVVCVFGSVGGRTEMRRAALGKAADKFADECILTSDNPNFENPLDILSKIADNITGVPYRIIPDREEAIRFAIENADDGDFILICGKGHEKYQLVSGNKIPFDEKEIVIGASKIKANI